MTKEDHTFLHDIMNKLAKIDGFTNILKSEIGENERILKIEKSTSEAIELVLNHRRLLEGLEKQKK